jgi:hypothetical protein
MKQKKKKGLKARSKLGFETASASRPMAHIFLKKNAPEGRHGVRQLAAALDCLPDISAYSKEKACLRLWDELISARFAIN